MDMKFTNIFYCERYSKNYPNWDFRFENVPSGNPGRPAADETSGLAVATVVRDPDPVSYLIGATTRAAIYD
jgi:hypothetical protein